MHRFVQWHRPAAFYGGWVDEQGLFFHQLDELRNTSSYRNPFPSLLCTEKARNAFILSICSPVLRWLRKSCCYMLASGTIRSLFVASANVSSGVLDCQPNLHHLIKSDWTYSISL